MKKISFGFLIILTLSILFTNFASASVTRYDTGQRGGETEEFITYTLKTFNETENGEWVEKYASNEFYNELNMEEIVSPIEDDVNSKTNIEVDPIYIKIYDKPHLQFLNKYWHKIGNSAEEMDYDGVIIYWLDYGVWAESFSDRLSNEKLREEIAKEAWRIRNEEGRREGIAYLLKETAEELSSESGEECEPGNPKDCGAADDMNCNPTTADFSGMKHVCCPGSQRYNGEECAPVKGANCQGEPEICEEGLECNSMLPKEEVGDEKGVDKHCCPEDSVWQEEMNYGDKYIPTSQCARGEEGFGCERDSQCDQSHIANLKCNPTTDDADLEKACCPKGETWNGEECINRVGEDCNIKDDQCPERMECTSVVPNSMVSELRRPTVESKCCPEDGLWNGEKCVKGEKGAYCTQNSQCKDRMIMGDLHCNPTINSGLPSACCPEDKVWNGNKQACVRKEGVSCETKEECPGDDWVCNSANSEEEKGCCPSDEYWSGNSCVPEGGVGFECETTDDCKENTIQQITPKEFNVPHNLNCNPTSHKATVDKACCDGTKVWNGDKCVSSEECVSGCALDGWTCNSVDSSVTTHCCPEEEIWTGDGCGSAEKTENCQNDAQCSLLLKCNPTAEDISEGKCCPNGEVYSKTKGECTKLDRGDECVADKFCKDLEGEKRNCNPSLSQLKGKGEKSVCCPGYTVYDETQDTCRYLNEGEVCTSSQMCKSDLGCYSSTEEGNRRSYCCPDFHRYDGESCKPLYGPR